MKQLELNHQTQREVHTMLSGGKPVLMLLHAKWCSHCIALQPAWQDTKKKLAKEDGIHVVEVEYDFKLLLPPNIPQPSGFPTIEVVRNGRVVSEYNGDRSSKSITNYALANAENPVKPKKPAVKPPAVVAPKKRKAAQPLQAKKRNILKKKK